MMSWWNLKLIAEHRDDKNPNLQSIFSLGHQWCWPSQFICLTKASRPMTYKHLTVEMIKSIGKNGIINQTLLKTNGKYGFDSLLFSADELTLVTGYMNYIRPRLNPGCNYLLACRNDKQISKLTNIFGRVVYEAIGKYINLLVIGK